jgi:hypothetical protein
LRYYNELRADARKRNNEGEITEAVARARNKIDLVSFLLIRLFPNSL